MKLRNLAKLSALMALLALTPVLHAQDATQPAAAQSAQAAAAQHVPAPASTKEGTSGKQLYLPETINRVPAGNDFTDPNAEFSFARMLEGPDVAVFWSKAYGDDPTKTADPNSTFDPKRILSECERFCTYYINDMEYLKKGHSVSDKYKFLIFIFEGAGGTAFGGGMENKIGAFWAPAGRVHREPYGVVAHELAHSFQYLSRADSGAGSGMGESAAQFFLWQVLPEWQTFENYHLQGNRTGDDFMGQTHLAFGHQRNQYHTPYVIEYFSYKHGLKFWGDLNRQAQRGEDVVATYKRITNINQDQFNDEMFDADRRFITWDMPRIQQTSKPYRNQHHTELNAISNEEGWYRIAPSHAPQNYGYNGIKLAVPAANSKVTVDFKGMPGAAGYNPPNHVDLAGWRYGFVAYKKDESRVYSDTFKDAEGKGTFTVPADTEYLWLVVTGAPKEHFINAGGRRGGPGGPTSATQGGGRGRRGGRGGRGTNATTGTLTADIGAVVQARGATVAAVDAQAANTNQPGAAAAQAGGRRGGRRGQGAAAGAAQGARGADAQGTSTTQGRRGARGAGQGGGRGAAPPPAGGTGPTDEQWPYKIRLEGTTIDAAMIK